MDSGLPFLDLEAPDFSTKSKEVIAARQGHWCAQTPFGYAVLRHREAGLLLRDKRLRQGSHNWPDTLGLKGSFAEFWKRSIISQEGPTHRALRQIAVSALTSEFIESLKPAFDRSADTLAQAIADAGQCEFMHDFSSIYSGHAICILLDLPLENWETISHNASELGLAMGVNGKQYEPRFNAATNRLMTLSDMLIERVRSGQDKTSYVARLHENFHASGITDLQILRDLIVISIFGGVDTTRSQLGFTMALFANHPEQWKALREDPDLVSNAVEESLRAWPTTTWATRQAIEDFTFKGIEIRENTIVHVLAHATARDPAICKDPEFNITKRRKLHFCFGGGAHHCLGHLVARTDIACALRALSERISRIHFDGEAEWMPDSGNTSPIYLPLSFEL